MKKFISIIICAIVAAMIAVAFAKSVEKSATLFNQNVNALTRNSGVTGGAKARVSHALYSVPHADLALKLPDTLVRLTTPKAFARYATIRLDN